MITCLSLGMKVKICLTIWVISQYISLFNPTLLCRANRILSESVHHCIRPRRISILVKTRHRYLPLTYSVEEGLPRCESLPDTFRVRTIHVHTLVRVHFAESGHCLSLFVKLMPVIFYKFKIKHFGWRLSTKNSWLSIEYFKIVFILVGKSIWIFRTSRPENLRFKYKSLHFWMSLADLHINRNL